MNRIVDDVVRENEQLKQEFARLGLDLAPVWSPTPGDPELENRQLNHLLDWVRAYRECPGRTQLERRGYRFPPIEPDFDPDTDWLRFERWLNGGLLTWNFAEKYGSLRDPASMTDEEVEGELTRILERLWDLGIAVDLFGAVPDRAVYAYLRRKLAETSFEVTAPGGFWHIGCRSECDGCFQRPWCDLSRELEALNEGSGR